jgi:hypothetical protein
LQSSDDAVAQERLPPVGVLQPAPLAHLFEHIAGHCVQGRADGIARPHYTTKYDRLDGLVATHDIQRVQQDLRLATPMTSSDFELVGGLWIVAAFTWGCIADVNGDGLRDGLDIQPFVNALLTP